MSGSRGAPGAMRVDVRHHACGCSTFEPLLDRGRDLGQHRREDEVDGGGGGEDRHRLERRGLHAVADVRELDDADDVGERRVLEERDDVVHERRQRDLERLREDDVGRRLERREPERARRLGLAARHRLDAGADRLRVVRADVHRERRRGRREVGELQPRHDQRDREEDEQHLDEQRRAADRPRCRARPPSGSAGSATASRPRRRGR